MKKIILTLLKGRPERVLALGLTGVIWFLLAFVRTRFASPDLAGYADPRWLFRGVGLQVALIGLWHWRPIQAHLKSFARLWQERREVRKAELEERARRLALRPERKIGPFRIRSLFRAVAVGISIPVGLFCFELLSPVIEGDYNKDMWQYSLEPLPIHYQAHPILGGLVRENFRHQGRMPWEERYNRNNYDDYDVRSSRFGFFTEHPVDNFPAKEAGEVRLVLVGGSGAQGWGGRTNSSMFYSLVQAGLDKRFAGVRVRVINIASAGHQLYPNCAATLDYFAHDLRPDAIVAYVGANDLGQPHANNWIVPGTNAFRHAYEYPTPIWVLGKLFPRMTNRYGLGPWLKRNLYGTSTRKASQEAWLRYLGAATQEGKPLSPRDLYDKVVLPFFLRGAHSIERNFPSVPLVLAWQAVHRNHAYNSWYWEGVYEEFYADVKANLEAAPGDRWTFVDANRLAREPEHSGREGWLDGSVAIHCDDVGHEILSEILIQALDQVVKRILAKRQAAR